MQKWIHKFDGVNNVILSDNGDLIMCDEEYYPAVILSDSEWRMVAKCPEMFNKLEEIQRFLFLHSFNNFERINTETAMKHLHEINILINNIISDP